MRNTTSTAAKYPRLVVQISPQERSAIRREAKKEGFKNEHRWATAKLATAIRDARESSAA